LFPLTGRLEQSGPQRASAAQLAVDYINNNGTILSGATHSLIINDTETRPDIGLIDAVYQIQQHVVGSVGEASSTVSMTAQATCAAFNIPQISYSSTSPELSNKNLYPTFVRTCPSDAFQGIAESSLFKGITWTVVSQLSCCVSGVAMISRRQ